MRTLRERVIHTVLFEAGAIAVATPAIGMVTGASAADSGLLSVLVSVGAVVANALWTWLFDRWVPTRRRSLAQRFGQAAGLEVVIAVYTIPLTMVLTDASFMVALGLDAAAIVFFLLYGMLYNAAFDAAVRAIEARRAPRITLRPGEG